MDNGTDISKDTDVDTNIDVSILEEIFPLKKIGEGVYGCIYETPNGNVIKCFKYPREQSTIRELSIIKCLKGHPNIVSVTNNYIYRNLLTLEMEKAKCDLRCCILDVKKEQRPYIMWQLLHAIKHMHSYNIAHRDVKPSNILLFGDITIKLCDFGLAKPGISSGKTHTNEVVSIWYRAPEVILNPGKYTNLVDIWACGTILLQMILGENYPLKDNTEITLLTKIFNLLGTPTEKSWEGVSKTQNWKNTYPKFKGNLKRQLQNTDVSEDEYNLLHNLLSWEPSRITAQQALQHPYFKDIRNNNLFSVSVENKKFINLKEPTVKQGKLFSRKQILFSWMWDVKSNLKLSKETLITSYFLFNAYCRDNRINRYNIQLVGTSCLIISSSLYDTYPIDEKIGSNMTDNIYCEKVIKNAVQELLKYFKYDLIYFTDACDESHKVFAIMCCIMSSEKSFTMSFKKVETVARQIVNKVISEDTKKFVSFIKQMPEEDLKYTAMLCLC